MKTVYTVVIGSGNGSFKLVQPKGHPVPVAVDTEERAQRYADQLNKCKHWTYYLLGHHWRVMPFTVFEDEEEMRSPDAKSNKTQHKDR